MWLLGDDARISRGRRSFLVMGLGYFGAELAVRLAELGQEVVGVDQDASTVQRLANRLTQTIELDATDHDALSTLGVSNFDVCIVGRGSVLEDSISITMSLKELEAKYVIAKAQNDRQAKILERLGVEMIVFPELDMAHHIAEMLVHPRIVGEIELGDDYVVEALKLPQRHVGQTFGKVESALPVGLKILGVQIGDEMVKSPAPEVAMDEGSILVVWGRRSRLEALK